MVLKSFIIINYIVTFDLTNDIFFRVYANRENLCCPENISDPWSSHFHLLDQVSMQSNILMIEKTNKKAVLSYFFNPPIPISTHLKNMALEK